MKTNTIENLSEDELLHMLIEQAKQIGACERLKGDEDIQGLVRLLFTPQGAEFCISNRFPAGQTWRQLRSIGIDNQGVYVDQGDMRLFCPETAAFVGRTTATVECRDTTRYTYVVLRGANLIIDAYDWAVVVVYADPTAHVVKKAHNNAIII